MSKTYRKNSLVSYKDGMKLRPLRNERVKWGDGYATERTVDYESDGRHTLAPSLWMSKRGPVDMSKGPLLKVVRDYRKRSGKYFPSASSRELLMSAFANRSDEGGATHTPLERYPGRQPGMHGEKMVDAPKKTYVHKHKKRPWAKGLPDNTGKSKYMIDITDEIREKEKKKKKTLMQRYR